MIWTLDSWKLLMGLVCDLHVRIWGEFCFYCVFLYVNVSSRRRRSCWWWWWWWWRFVQRLEKEKMGEWDWPVLIAVVCGVLLLHFFFSFEVYYEYNMKMDGFVMCDGLLVQSFVWPCLCKFFYSFIVPYCTVWHIQVLWVTIKIRLKSQVWDALDAWVGVEWGWVFTFIICLIMTYD